MAELSNRLRVAFIYPPYGPPNLANLGIAVLAGALEQRGFKTRTFYWNYRVCEAIPARTAAERRHIYHLMTQRDFFPWNEWIFSRQVFGAAMEEMEADVDRQLAQLDQRGSDATHPYKPSELIRGLADAAPELLREMAAELADFDVVGITSTFYQNGAALALAKTVKETNPDTVVIMGGANCDGDMGSAVAEMFPFVDYVFSGEVDHSFPEFIERLERGDDVSGVPGLVRRDGDGKAVLERRAVPITDMDALPIPVFDDFIAQRKQFGLFDADNFVLPLESSRGCWWGAKHHCTFCGLNANGMAYRQKSETRFREEVAEIVARYGAKYLFMADNILSAKYYRDFIQWAKEQEINVNYFYEIKANVTRAQVADLADAGVTMVQPGIESFSSPVLKLMQKGVRGIQNVAFLKYAAEYGVIPAWNFLAGFPGEDPFEYERMARELPKFSHFAPPNGVVDIEFHRFSPYHNDPDAFGIRLRPHRNYFYIYPLPEHAVARLAYVFEVDGRGPTALSYLAGLNRAVNDWIGAYRGKRSSLTWIPAEDEIVVRDRRAGFNHADYRLGDHAVAVFQALDSPSALDTLRNAGARVEQRHKNGAQAASRPPRPAVDGDDSFRIVPAPAPVSEIRFSRAEFEAAPAACVQPMIDAGFVYEDDGLLVTLPTAARSRAIDPGWRRIGI